ncbi:hypothetical protein JB92DRAFT_3044372 [Gautieria morchelliformis]|nr:hypothetical protein JB92DRAFT_3044372 [Gautieria morchelliformis]
MRERDRDRDRERGGERGDKERGHDRDMEQDRENEHRRERGDRERTDKKRERERSRSWERRSRKRVWEASKDGMEMGVGNMEMGMGLGMGMGGMGMMEDATPPPKSTPLPALFSPAQNPKHTPASASKSLPTLFSPKGSSKPPVLSLSLPSAALSLPAPAPPNAPSQPPNALSASQTSTSGLSLPAPDLALTLSTAEKDMAIIRSKRGGQLIGVPGTGPGQGGKAKYRKRSRATPPGKCHSCNIRETPEWRRGPDGARTLCNACGLHYAKLIRKRDKTLGPGAAEAPDAPPIDLEMLRASARLIAADDSKPTILSLDGASPTTSDPLTTSLAAHPSDTPRPFRAGDMSDLQLPLPSVQGSGRGPGAHMGVMQVHQWTPPGSFKSLPVEAGAGGGGAFSTSLLRSSARSPA